MRVLAEGETDPPNLPTDEGGFEDNLEDDGVYVCAGCGAECYLQDCRFEAGCGWPCFFIFQACCSYLFNIYAKSI